MKFKLILILFFLVIFAVNCSSKTGSVTALKKADGISYHVVAGKKSLSVVIGGKNGGPEKIPKVYYNKKDYTIYVKEFLESKPTVFVSKRIMIFSEEKEIKLSDGGWRFGSGIIFIPGDKEVSFIESSGILYYPETNVLMCSNAIKESKKIDPEKK